MFGMFYETIQQYSEKKRINTQEINLWEVWCCLPSNWLRRGFIRQEKCLVRAGGIWHTMRLETSCKHTCLPSSETKIHECMSVAWGVKEEAFIVAREQPYGGKDSGH